MEHIIFLNKHSDDNDKYSYDQIVIWLNKLLSAKFLGKDIICKQLSGAEYEVYGEFEYISIKFIPNDSEQYPYRIRVPVNMVAMQPNGNIVDFLLHIIGGFVDELEIYNMDLTIMDGEFSIDNVAYRVDEEVAIQKTDNS